MSLAIGARKPTGGIGSAVLAYLPGAVVPAVAALVGSALFARGFGPTDFGRYALATGVATLGSAASAQWLQQSANRFLPASDDADNRAAFELGWRVLFVATLLLGLLVALAAWPLVTANGRDILLPTVLLTTSTAAYAARLAPLQARGDARSFSRYRVLGVVLQTIFGLFAMRAGVGPTITAQALGLAILLPSMIGNTEGAASPIGTAAVNQKLREFWRYGAPLGAWAAASSLLAIGERYVLVWARGDAEGGLYAANAGPIVMGVTLVAMPFLTAIHPRLMRAWDNGETARTERTLAAATEAFVYAGLGLAAVTTLLAPLMVGLLGDRFRIGSGAMGAIALGAALGQASLLLHKPLEFAARSRSMLVFGLVATAAKLVAMAALAPRFGYGAAPWTTVGAYLLYGTLCLAGSRNILRVGLDWPRLGFGLLATVALCTIPGAAIAAAPAAVVFAAIAFTTLRRLTR